MTARKQIAPEVLAEAKRLYEQTLAPVDDIAAMMDVGRPLFYRFVRKGGWRGRRARVGTFQFARALTAAAAASIAPAPAEQPRADVAAPTNQATEPQRLAIAQRIMDVVEHEMEAAERIVKAIRPKDLIEAEHGARTLARVSRALREIKALTEPKEATPPDETDDDPVPRDIDEFRQELARRIRGFIEARRNGSAGLSGEPEGPLG